MVARLLPPDFPANAALHTVWQCIDVWHAGTRDAYLAMLHELVDLFLSCSALWPPAGVFMEAQLWLYVDLLLSQHGSLHSMPAASSLLSVAFVCKKLSTLMVCFQGTTLLPLVWPPQAHYQLVDKLATCCKAR